LINLKVILFLLSWTIYPNPAKDYFYVEATEGILPSYVEIYDMNGRLMQEEYIGKGVSIKLINVHLKDGMYIVYLEDK
jgi:hypothetical protein